MPMPRKEKIRRIYRCPLGFQIISVSIISEKQCAIFCERTANADKDIKEDEKPLEEAGIGLPDDPTSKAETAKEESEESLTEKLETDLAGDS